jgi:hypothetical protein
MGLVGLKIKDNIPYGSSASGSSMGLVGLKIKDDIPYGSSASGSPMGLVKAAEI